MFLLAICTSVPAAAFIYWIELHDQHLDNGCLTRRSVLTDSGSDGHAHLEPLLNSQSRMPCPKYFFLQVLQYCWEIHIDVCCNRNKKTLN